MKKRLLFLFMSLLTAFGAWAEGDDMLSTPLTLEAIEVGTITFDNKAAGPVTYRVNGGEAQTISSGGKRVILVKADDRVAFYGDNQYYGSSENSFLYSSNLSCTADCYVYGNIMSLISSTDFANAKTLTEDNTFGFLFTNNTHLKSHPDKTLELPATTLATGCYKSMFANCTSLMEAPALPATTLAEGCYKSMFWGCTSLTKAPTLPATTLANYCYNSMFYGCTSLNEAPALPATTLAYGCYSGMFNCCTGLTEAPALPATTLAGACYQGMFSGTALTKAPALPAMTMAERCYESMFAGTALTEAPALPATTLAEYCYMSMFSSCTGLTVAPELPATTLVQSCYSGMFMGCTGLTEAPKLPATTLAKYCYGGMFWDCKNLTRTANLPATTLAVGCYYRMFLSCEGLTKAPALPATTLADSCYQEMFVYSGLTEAPELPATTLAKYCYRDMFGGCTSLTKAPAVLPATTLAVQCYQGMFSGTGLTEAPALPATELAGSCYYAMFYGCTGLTESPVLPATKGITNCYKEMFSGCKNLSIVTCLLSNPSGRYYSSWLEGVAATGTFFRARGASWSNIPEGWTVKIYGDETPENEDMLSTPLTLEAIGTGRITFDNKAAGPVTYRVNGGEAQTIESGTKGTIAVNFEDRVAFYGDNASYSNGSSTSNIYCSSCYIYGNVMSLVSSTDFANAKTLTRDSTFYNLFANNTHLKSHPDKTLELPATTLATGCYKSMFANCTSLMEAPALPATTLAEGCYESMFWCCTSLTKAPTLPATTLAEGCYDGMFSSCTRLTEAPVLPATTLAGYCYSYMFYDCTNLKNVTCLATDISAIQCTESWLKFVSSSGTFTKAAGVDWPTGESGIPEGWSVEERDPTGINAATSVVKVNVGQTYDLKGMKTPVNTKGLRIENGRKIVIR